MRINKTLSFFLLFLLTLTSCGHSYKLEGESSDSYLDGKKLYLKVLENDKWVNLDSADVVHGKFKMNGSIDSIMVVSLFVDNESVMPIVLESGTIKISMSEDLMKAEGTPLNDKLYEFIDKKNAIDSKVQDLDHKETQMIVNGQDMDVVHAQISAEADALAKDMNANIKNFISQNYNNVLGPSVFMMLCSAMPYPMITPQIDDILKNAPESFKQNHLIRDFINKAHENEQLIEEHQRLEQSEETSKNQQSKNNKLSNLGSF